MTEPDDTELWALLRSVAAGDAAAWPALMAKLEPELVGFARRQPIGRLGDHDDSPREITARVFARLHARDHAAIKKLCSQEPLPPLRAWLRIIVRRSAIDYMRQTPEFERPTATRPGRWISLASLASGAPPSEASSIDEHRRLVMTTLREMVARATAEFAARGDDAFTHLALEWKIARIHVRRLATRGEQLVRVLVALCEGRSQIEIAEQMSLTRREVELTVRYLEELMRERLGTT